MICDLYILVVLIYYLKILIGFYNILRDIDWPNMILINISRPERYIFKSAIMLINQMHFSKLLVPNKD